MLVQIARIAHLFGVVAWVGGLLTAGLVAIAGKGSERRAVLEAARTALRAIATPGLVLAWLGGLSMLVNGWSAIYAHAGWMHAKLTLAVVLSGLHGALLARMRKAEGQDEEAARRALVLLTAIAGVLALVAVVLVVARPF